MARDDDGEKAVLGCAVLLGLLPLTLAVRAWVAAACWGWFAVPLGAPPVGAAHALGLILLAAAVTGVRWRGKADKATTAVEEVAAAAGYGLVLPGFVLLLAWAARSGMAAGY